MIAHGLAVPPSLAIILFIFKCNIHHVKLTIQSMFGYHSLETIHTPINSYLGFLVRRLHYSEKGLRKIFQASGRTGLVHHLRNVRGYHHTQNQQVPSWPDIPVSSMAISSACTTSCKLSLVCLAGFSLEDPAPETLTDCSYMGFAGPSKTKHEFGQNTSVKVWT